MPPEQPRTRNFSFLRPVALTLGGAAGIWAGNSYLHAGRDVCAVRYLGGVFPIMAGLLLANILPRDAASFSTSPPQGTVDWSRNFLSYGTAWFQGFLEGGMLAFLTLYLISLGMSQDRAGILISVTMIGVMLVQVPVAWLADRHGRLPVLLGCYAVVARRPAP